MVFLEKKIISNGWGLSTTYRLPWVIKYVKLVLAKPFSPLNLYIKISLLRLIIDHLISTELNSLRLRSSEELWMNKRLHGRWKVDNCNAFKISAGFVGEYFTKNWHGPSSPGDQKLDISFSDYGITFNY